MTYSTTHLALQSLLVWLLLSKKNKDYYLEHRWEYIIISLFAVFPDIDVFFGIHRSYTHSLILPVFVLLSMIVIELVHKETSPIESPTRKMVRFVKLATIMWLFHIFLDLTWGPLLLFWPINSNFYDLSIYFKLDSATLALLGIVPNWTIYSQSEGQNIYFINMTQEQREGIYGDYIEFYIAQFTLHVVVVLIWLVVIVFPAFKRKKNKEREPSKVGIGMKLFWSRIKRHLTLLGLFVLFTGLVLGPIIGKENTMNYTVSSNYTNTQTNFDPTLGVLIESKPQSTASVSFSSYLDLINYNVSLLLTDNDTFFNFFNDFDDLTKSYYNGTITYTQLISSYFILVEDAKLGSIFEKRLIHNEVINGTNIILNSTEENQTFYFLTLVDEWNITESYIYRARIEISYTMDRSKAQIEGGILDSIGLAMIISDQIIAYFQNKRKTKQLT
ncbi:hypothetical protein EU534_01955 [Candidatus Heimdallarchaeota archaeon]|nr:MAG: hypothetical protein EU534_01955 [Candidatus Heimdallarchaeota archaeon]